MGAFNSSTIWNSTRIWEPTFGSNPGDPLNADWTMLSGTQTPRDAVCISANEIHQPWSYPHFGAEKNPDIIENTGFTMPQSAYTGWRFSFDVRFSGQTVPPRNDGQTALNAGLIRSSSGTSLAGVSITQTLHIGPDTWTFSSTCGSITLSSLATNRYYRLGIMKLGTRLSAWMNPNPDTGSVPTPWGVAGDNGLLKLQEIAILPTYATQPFLGFYSSSNYVGFNALNGVYDRGGIAYPRLEELALSMMGPILSGAPKEPINLPPGSPWILSTPDYSPWNPPSLSFSKLEETAAYHRYKNTRSAMAIYNNLSFI